MVSAVWGGSPRCFTARLTAGGKESLRWPDQLRKPPAGYRASRRLGFIRAVSLDPADVLKLQPNSRENQPKSRYSQTHARESYAVPHSSQSAPLLPNGWPDACSDHPSTRATEAETGTDNTHFDHGFYGAQGHRSRCDSQLAFGAHRSDECPDHEQWQEKQYENVHRQQRKRGYGIGFPDRCRAEHRARCCAVQQY